MDETADEAVEWSETCEGLAGDEDEYGAMKDEELELDPELDPEDEGDPKGPKEAADDAGVGGPIIKFNIPRLDCATICSSIKVIV